MCSLISICSSAAEADATTTEVAATKLLWNPCLELTFNHGTDVEEGPSYHNGSDPMYAGAAAPQGFAKLGFWLLRIRLSVFQSYL